MILDDERDPVDALAEEFVARHRRGERPTVTEYVRLRPDLETQVRELFPAALLLEGIKGPPPVCAERMPDQLGDYRLLREIGRGGMGAVYEAEQVSLGRRVALKVLSEQARLGAGGVERFRREARAAARLHHTSIVPVFGVGEDAGRHYYVMQLIHGEGLDQVLARLSAATGAASTEGAIADPAPATDQVDLPSSRSSSPPRTPVPADLPTPGTPDWFRFVADLGAQVADALAYAHGQNVLHRDIKPANLLLDAQGRVHVADFGLAKLFADDDLTAPGDMAGTLRYSPPERFKGVSEPRGDLFSLALTLRELATLRPAYGERDPALLVKQAMEARLDPAPGLPPDLETILLKALAPEPEARYASAAELADDLRRFTEDRPVKARRTGLLEHAWRWCRRNPAVAGLAAALLVALVAGFAGVVWKWREAESALDRAEKTAGELRVASLRADVQRRLAEGNLDLALAGFERVMGRLLPPRPGTPLDDGEEAGGAPVLSREAAAVLEDMVEFYERFAEANGDDPRLVRDTAKALGRVGSLRQRLGQPAEAETALVRAGELLARLPGQELERGRLANDLGVALRSAGKLAEAESAHVRALGLLEKTGGSALETARARHLVGSAQWRQGRPKEAEKTLRAALASLERSEKTPESRHLLARTRHELAIVLVPTSLPEAAECRRKALDLLEALAKEFPQVPDYRAELAEALMVGGRARWGRDEPRVRRAVKLADELARQHPAVPEYVALAARAHQRLGAALLGHLGRTDDAVKELRQAMALYQELEGRAVVSMPGTKLAMNEARLLLSDALHRKGGPGAEAAKLVRDGVGELEKVLAAAPRNRFARGMLARSYRSMGQHLMKQGKKDEASRLLKKADDLSRP
ncbi:MAG: protein kinase [Gemmataceae bacterium]|nr:protein kinase [Gemmataceae bacterium]